MKKLIRKEFQEQMKVVLLGVAIFAFIIVQAYRDSIGQITAVAGGQDWVEGRFLQPLLAPMLHGFGVCYCAVFGIVLGWLQIRSERHPDLWAFLIHRPMTRSRILLGKIAAGLCLYALGTGLPMLVLIAVVLLPGHVAAPFEWPMVFPLAAIFLLGIVYYFAGMLIGLRQARWYGSRGFALGLAIYATVEMFAVRDFWQAVMVLLAAGAILAVAVWGSFRSGGYYRGQVLAGKLALTATSVAAGQILVGMAVILSIVWLGLESGGPPFVHYEMNRGGALWTERNGKMVDFEGKPILGDKTGRQIGAKDFDRFRAPAWRVFARFDRQGRDGLTGWEARYWDSERFFNPWRIAHRTLWYLTDDGRLVGYNTITRRQTATLKPGGNSAASTSAEMGFLAAESYIAIGTQGAETGFLAAASYRDLNNAEALLQPVLASSTTLYHVDLDARTLLPFFTVTNGDRIGGFTTHPRQDYSPSHHAVVVTRQAIQYVDFDGQVEWSVPYEPSYRDYPQIIVYLLAATNRFAVEFVPSDKAITKSGWKLPRRVEWFDAKEGLVKTVDLPLPNRPKPPLAARVLNVLMPAAVPPRVWGDQVGPRDPRCLIPGAFCAVVGWWLGRRYNFSIEAQIGWGVFLMLFGLAGLLAFLSVQEWPARETCPHCKKRRVVDREQCPHCGVAFAPPPENGTEIFEPLPAD